MTDRLNPEALEQAAVLDGEHHERTEWNNIEGAIQEQYLEDARRTITNYLAALPAPRTITTVEELDALPVGSVIRDSSPYICEKDVEQMWMVPGSLMIGKTNEIDLPATVLWMPTEGSGE